jgi:hypothetical protein
MVKDISGVRGTRSKEISQQIYGFEPFYRTSSKEIKFDDTGNDTGQFQAIL